MKTSLHLISGGGLYHLPDPTPPLLNKRGQRAIGADLTITYHSDLAQCEILLAGSRYTNAGNFKARTFLPFIQPAFILDLYPHLLSPKDNKISGLPLLLHIQPRTIVPRLLSSSDEGAPWPSSSAYVSLASPLDLDTFHIKEDVWPEPLSKTSVFIKLGSYLVPENDRPPHKGVHICYVLLLFPIE
ncbi:hypothetical protein EDB81DRAFT_849448 [Dactylonectria macrodidyma]|uniref:Uncharacterized protein n=1 Tax=Dactylonectria macrodidyma TaxID=307937 RepID=A0A9P9I707_9HYPO|nr:hypothetical protein EDB81DRAFT_849448 [Dactylonectria macrodidyma]